jgi:hypothetical protein
LFIKRERDEVSLRGAQQGYKHAETETIQDDTYRPTAKCILNLSPILSGEHPHIYISAQWRIVIFKLLHSPPPPPSKKKAPTFTLISLYWLHN